MNIFERFIPAIVGTVIGGPATGAAVYAGTKANDYAKNAEADVKRASTNPPLPENTVSRKAQVNTEQVSGIKQVGFTAQTPGGISPQMLLAGGFGLIVILMLAKG